MSKAESFRVVGVRATGIRDIGPTLPSVSPVGVGSTRRWCCGPGTLERPRCDAACALVVEIRVMPKKIGTTLRPGWCGCSDHLSKYPR